MLRFIVAFALVVISLGCDRGPEVAEPTLETAPWLFPEPQIEQLASKDAGARAIAARSLGRMGAKAEAALPELEKLLEDKEEHVREVAKEAIEKIRAEL